MYKKAKKLSKQFKNNFSYGHKLSEKTKEKLRQCNLGKHHSKVTKDKIRKAILGRKHSEESKRKMKEKVKKGKESPYWKGDKVGYVGLHQRLLKYWSKKGICEYCKRYRKTDWSNIDHKYKMDKNDWRELCRSCHTKYDYRVIGTRL